MDNHLNPFMDMIENIPMTETKIISGVSPKFISKNKFVQKVLIKLFGYKVNYKTVKAKTLKIKAEDYPECLRGDITLTFGSK